MTDTFAVGDEVTALGNRGTIAYGPFSSTFDRHTMYVVRHAAGNEKSYQSTDLVTSPTLAVGDTVKYVYGGNGKLVAGPFKAGHGSAVWVVELANGTHITPTQNALTKVSPADDAIKVGDSVRVLYAAYADEEHGKTGRVTSTDEEWSPTNGTGVHQYRVELDVPSADGDGSIFVRDVERADTETVDDVTYDLSAKYRDVDGDIWRLGRIDGQARGNCDEDREDISWSDSSLDFIVSEWGPLTRI